MQKTVFIVINRGMIIRHLFGACRLLLDGSVRFVFFIPRGVSEVVEKDCADEVAAGSFIFERINDVRHTFFRARIFHFFQRLSLVNRTSVNASWLGSGKAEPVSRPLYILAFPILLLMHVLPFTRPLMERLERTLYPDRDFDHFFERYKPDLVLVCSIFSKNDIAFIKAARRFKVRSATLLKGWDQLDKWRFIATPDFLLAPNKALEEYALRYHGFPKERLRIVGFLPFDIYKDKSILMSRQAFCQERGLDPSRKIIFFGSEGPWSPNDNEVAARLIESIQAGRVPPASLIIRPHFGSVADHHFKYLKGEHVYIDDSHRLILGFPDKWYPTDDELAGLANTLYHADVMVCFRSTLSLDAFAYDKPVINLTTGGFIRDGKDATAELYRQIFYADLLKLGAVTLVTEAKLTDALRGAFERPEALHEEREAALRLYVPNLFSTISAKQSVADAIREFLA